VFDKEWSQARFLKYPGLPAFVKPEAGPRLSLEPRRATTDLAVPRELEEREKDEN
jgi:hypothetical protein